MNEGDSFAGTKEKARKEEIRICLTTSAPFYGGGSKGGERKKLEDGNRMQEMVRNPLSYLLYKDSLHAPYAQEAMCLRENACEPQPSCVVWD